MNFSGQNVAVVGLGLSNIPLIGWLLRQGAKVTAFDRQTAPALAGRYSQVAKLGVTDFCLGPGYLDRLQHFPIIFLTPGIRKDLPEIAAARAAGAIITGEVPQVLARCRAPVIGVTGTAGKTTVTTLLGEVLRRSGKNVYVGGNIGRALIDVVDEIPAAAVVVLELSSFQLELAETSPGIAVITNISPNHLDVHPTMDAYTAAKCRIYQFQSEAGRVVVNADHPGTAKLLPELGRRAVPFSRHGDPGGFMAAFRFGDELCWRLDQERLPVLLRREIRLLGDHNVDNVLAVIAAAFLAGAGLEAIRRTVPAFAGVEHRLEPVRTIGGVQFINDSKATAPVETIAALAAVSEPLILIAGGYDKLIPFDDLAAAIIQSKVHSLILLGTTAAAIGAAVKLAALAAGRPGPVIEFVPDLAGAVARAQALARPGDTVLLSPAAASYDMYGSFEERGRHYKKLVTELRE